MQTNKRYEYLVRRHRYLDEAIKLNKSDYVGDKNLQKMKYEKAAIKREIEKYESSVNH